MQQNKSVENKLYRSAWWAVPAFIAGLCAGYFLKGGPQPSLNFSEDGFQVRQDGYKFISPLLECEKNAGISSGLVQSFKADLAGLVHRHSESGIINDAAVYFRDLNNGPWYGFKEQEKFRPASFLKIPIAMAFYRAAEDDPGLLKKRIKFAAEQPLPPDRVQAIVPGKKIKVGREYTVEQLIEAMLRYSDNQALFLLYGPLPDHYLTDLYRILGVEKDVLEKVDGTLSIRSFATFYRILFNASYLNREHSEKLLFWLSEGEYRNALVAGLPGGVTVSHKFGEGGVMGGERQLQDCGIVYYPGRPYLLCVMAKGTKLENLEKFIKAVSRLVYYSVDTSVRKK